MNTIQYDIYQIKPCEQFHGIRFEGSRFLKHAQIPIHPDHYDKIYSGTVDTNMKIQGNTSATSEVLEGLYEKFNLYHPADFRGHSLSVSDIVVLHENGRSTAHLCDSFGFMEVPEFILPTAPSPLLSPPSAIGEQNYLKNAEEYLEENYNNISGSISTQNKLTPRDDTLPHPEYHEEANTTAIQEERERQKESSEKPSVLAKLTSAREEIKAQPSPATSPMDKRREDIVLN